MISKRVLIFLVILLAVTSMFSYNYFKLRQEYNRHYEGAKYTLTGYLNSSLTFASRVDINKIASGDKYSITALISMYEAVSNAYAASIAYLRTDYVLVDGIDMREYQTAINEILNKAVKSELNMQDVERFNVITEDLRLIYRYINDNKVFDSKRYVTEFRPKLKLLNK